MLVAILSDTHTRRIPGDCVERLSGADLILHAGDLAAASVLDELEAIGPPVKAVHGNVDSSELCRRLPAELLVTAGGAIFAMLHDAGPAVRRIERMRTRFPKADAVVFGHSHIPLHEEKEGFHIFNPGSPTDRRRSPTHTMGLARVEDGSIAFEHVEVG